MKPFQCSKLTELLVFQFNLLHRRLLTNTFPKEINLIDSDLCSFCSLEKETLIYLFWNCSVIDIPLLGGILEFGR